jgi:hypothetical protein
VAHGGSAAADAREPSNIIMSLATNERPREKKVK